MYACFCFDFRAVLMSRKRVRDFEITLSQCTLYKDHVFFGLEELCSELLVAQEAHFDGGKHYHVYAKTEKKYKVVELRELVEVNLWGEDPPGSIHISSLKNSRHWIKYCTKEDTEPKFKNVDPNLFHQSFKIYDYVRRNEEFDRLHPFIRQNPCLTNIVEKAHAKYWGQVQNKLWQRADVAYEPDRTIDWVGRMSLFAENGKHIYLWGGTGVGKSTYVNWLARRRGSSVCFLPCTTSPFEFSEVASGPRLVIAPDAPAGYLLSHRSMILQLCDNSLVSINVKCAPIKQLVFKGQLIVVSNFAPEGDEALLRRFIVIEANEYAVQQKVQVKEEVPEEVDETITISSESDSEEETWALSQISGGSVSCSSIFRREDSYYNQ